MYEQMLIPYDGSKEAKRGATHGIELAAELGSTIHGLYVIDTGGHATLPLETAWNGISEILHEEGRLALEEIERLSDSVPVETTVERGKPSVEIVEYARTHGCDTIVMGTHGRGGINRLLLGSVAEQVVRSAPVPVVTISVTENDRAERLEAAPSG